MNIWLIPLEQIETRYTYEWFTEIPDMIVAHWKGLGRQLSSCTYKNRIMGQPGFDFKTYAPAGSDCDTLINVEGELPSQEASTGAFINFASTNIWKSSQAQLIAHAFHGGQVQPGDKFYFTDAWNPTIIQVRYMSDLLGIPVQIIGQWHAGWHDPHDFLGRNIKDSRWVSNFERSLFWACDTNLFTTNFYANLFIDRVGITVTGADRILRCGYPNAYLVDILGRHYEEPKERIVLFPHRIAPEKQVEIFKDLERVIHATYESLRDVRFIVCQEQRLSKAEYRALVGKSQVVFSAALQETYGIAQTEAVFAGALPLSPDRLSYSEMYDSEFLYPSSWTESWDSYQNHKVKLAHELRKMLEKPGSYRQALHRQRVRLMHDYIGDTQICELLASKGDTK